MRAIDTNVLVRLIVRNDAGQVRLAEEFVARGAWVSNLVLAQTLWSLHWLGIATVNLWSFPTVSYSR